MAINHPPTFLGWGLRLLVLEPPGCSTQMCMDLLFPLYPPIMPALFLILEVPIMLKIMLA